MREQAGTISRIALRGIASLLIMTSLCAAENVSAWLCDGISHWWRCSSCNMYHTSIWPSCVVSIAITLVRWCGGDAVMYLIMVYGSCVQCIYWDMTPLDPCSIASRNVIFSGGVCRDGRTCHFPVLDRSGGFIRCSFVFVTLYMMRLSAAAMTAMYFNMLFGVGLVPRAAYTLSGVR